MKAWVFAEHGPTEVMKLVDIPKPELKPTDILVKNNATGSNPIDFKVRLGGPVKPSEEEPVVTGYDGAGVVAEIGSEVEGISVGDEVYYSGDIMRRYGSYAEYTPVDYRIVGKKPKSLSWVEASTIPLVAITAWETMKEDMVCETGETILIVNGSGGLGSFAIQLAKAIGLTVIATASRPETVEWAKDLGADYVISHRKPYPPQLEEIGYASGVRYIFNCYDTPDDLSPLMTILKPLGKLALTFHGSNASLASIDPVDAFYKRKSLIYTFMFGRASYNVNPEKQGNLLNEISKMIDEGKIKHTLKKTLTFDQIPEMMDLQAAGTTTGKIAATMD